MIELFLAVVLVALFGDKVGVQPGDTLAVGALVWLVLHMASSWVWPYRACPNPWCSKRDPIRGDRKGNYRRRAACVCCHGGDWRRLGARVMRRG